MSRLGRVVLVGVAAVTLVTQGVAAAGVGGATWTPAESETTAERSRFMLPGDSITFRTDETWSSEQVDGLAGYVDGGLRYTLEVNDDAGRLSATGYWATNHPDPAFDRDDDDGDRRWEEAEIIVGPIAPEPDRTYTSLMQFSRWHGKRQRGRCEWAWDRRKGEVVVLSQLSRHLLGEWQAERYTYGYDERAYPRVGRLPPLPERASAARCRDADPGTDQQGYVVTFARPLDWGELNRLVSAGSAKWTGFEAVGSRADDDRLWTCGGPFDAVQRLGPCTRFGLELEGISAAVGYLDGIAAEQLRESVEVAAVDGLRDTLTDLLFEVGGFGVERPGLTIDDRYWELVLTDQG